METLAAEQKGGRKESIARADTGLRASQGLNSQVNVNSGWGSQI